jgi:leader peptidase (prepilin peptidase)/N-methyltransferase
MTTATPSGASAVLLYLGLAVAGLVCGVAINALADDVDGMDEPVWRAATCVACGAPLPSTRYLPLANFARARRSCASCGKPATLRRPLLEATLALAFPLLAARILVAGQPLRLAPAGVFALDAICLCALAFIFAVDLEHRLILERASVYPPLALLVLSALIFDHKALAAMIFGVLIWGGLFALLYGLGWLLYRQEALGLGDVKLALLLGVLVGYPAAVTALVYTALIGAAVSLLLLGLGIATRKTFIPFGIFMVAGSAFALLSAPPYW